MSERVAIAGRELRSLRREKTIVLAVLIQLFVAAFSSFLVVGLVALHSPDATSGSMTVEVGVSGDRVVEVAEAVQESDTRSATVYDDRNAALSAFEAGDVDAVFHATQDQGGSLSVEAVAPEGDFRTTLIVVELRDALEELERTRRDRLADRLDRQPLPLPREASGNPYFGFAYTVLVPLLGFLPAFVSGSIATDSITEELERGTLELLRVAPITPGAILDGKALAAVVLAPVQAATWFALLGLNGVPVANVVPILAIVTGVTVAAVALGGGLAMALGERRGAQLAYSGGVLVLFAGASLLPEDPANATAKLAIGSPSSSSYLVAGGSLVAGALAYALARTAATRYVGE